MLKLSKHLGSKPTITPPKRSVDIGNDDGDLVQGTDRFSADREGPPGDGPLGAGGGVGLGRCQGAGSTASGTVLAVSIRETGVPPAHFSLVASIYDRVRVEGGRSP